MNNFSKEETIKLIDNLGDEGILEIKGLPYPKIGSGKVREIYDLGENLLIIASDRMSAFDVVLPNGIPGKGVILTQVSLFWFDQMEDIIEHHLVENHQEVLKETLKDHPELIPRSMIVKKLKPLEIEAIIRSYLAGSGWKDYQETGQLFEFKLPAGLQESSKLPSPLYTPTTKASEGHDMPVTREESRKVVGEEIGQKVEDISIDLFNRASGIAEKAGIILADTKFEFGLDNAGKLILIDEIFTPDSSRYWPANDYEPGRGQASFDKQFVRDYLNGLDWNKTAPGPALPKEVVEKTKAKYITALKALVNGSL